MAGPLKADNLLVWGAEGIDPAALVQAARAARLPFVPGHVALMPDAHVGIGATVGSVIPTLGAIVPAAVGVDIGCGMVASETSLSPWDLPDDLGPLLDRIAERIPAGVGKGHDERGMTQQQLNGIPSLKRADLTPRQVSTVCSQFGTLGSGNHFVEVCLDEREKVWTVLHSGSRGIGNQLAREHIDRAKGLMREYFVKLEDPELAYLAEGTGEFEAYIRDMLWCQEYAMASRTRMAIELNHELARACGREDGIVQDVINCHHNFTVRERHLGKDLWVTRKGAIRAQAGDKGVIPGSMGTGTYIIEGLGNRASYNSCSHGAGRRMSRGEAKRQLSAESLTEAMRGKSWNADRAGSLVDEHPEAYKDVRAVMAAQDELCTVTHTLTQVLNYKG